MNNPERDNLFKRGQPVNVKSDSEFLMQKRKFETSLRKTSIDIYRYNKIKNISDNLTRSLLPVIQLRTKKNVSAFEMNAYFFLPIAAI